MIAGGSAALLVADVPRALRFYVETLGFKLRGAPTADRAEVDAGEGLVLTLDRATSPVRGKESVRVLLEVNQPIDEVVAVLENRGVTFSGGVVVEGGRKRAAFTDLEGNTLYLSEPAAP